MQRAKRDLTEADIRFFEKEEGFLKVVKLFVKKMCAGKKNYIRASDFDYYLDWSFPAFLDKIDEEKKKNSKRITELEAAHYVLNFLFDLLQFACQYLIKADKTSADTLTENQNRKMFNPLTDLTIKDDFCMPLKFTYYISGFESLIQQICDSIEEICPQTDYLMRFWQIKNAEEPGKAE